MDNNEYEIYTLKLNTGVDLLGLVHPQNRDVIETPIQIMFDLTGVPYARNFMGLSSTNTFKVPENRLLFEPASEIGVDFYKSYTNHSKEEEMDLSTDTGGLLN